MMATFAVTAQSEYCVYQVDDYVSGPTGSNPYQFVEYNGAIYFAGSDPSAGAELLKYENGTISLVQDIRPGGLSSQPNRLTVFDGELYFAANDGTNGTELYKYNGTTATLAANINPGNLHSYPDNLIVVGDHLYFTADDGSTGNELWRFDGTTATQVADINPGIAPSLPLKLFEHGGNLYFQAMNATDGRELYEWDGTTLNNWDLNPGSGDSNPSFFFDYNGELIFSCTNGADGMELWEFNNGTPVMHEIAAGGPNGNPTEFAIFQGDLYFRASNLTTGAELYKFDGTSVSNVADILVGNFHSNPDNITKFGNQLVFTASDGNTGYELYKYDGANVSMIQELVPGSGSAFGAFNAIDFQIVGTQMWLLADDGTNGEEWWVYDGLDLTLAKDINPSGSCSATEPAVFGEFLYFSADNGTEGAEMWRVNTLAQLWDSTQVVTCGSWVSPGGQSFSGNGTYQVTDIIPSVACPGCDSLIYTDLEITSDSVLEVNYSVINCGTWVSPGGQVFTAEGTYAVSDTFVSTVCPGADSVINVDLEIVQLSNSVTVFGELLVAQASGANYQWLDCDNDYSFIPGATDQDFSPPFSGNYAVQLSLGGCVDTSNCYQVTVDTSSGGGGNSISENNLDSYVVVYPNPAENQITIMTELKGDYMVRILDYSGKVIRREKAVSSNTEIDLAEIESGVYLIEVTNADGRALKKFVKR